MDPADPQQVFVRNAQGQVWGPISLPSVELLFENGALAGPVHVSQDGVTFVEPGALPDIRDAFPRAVWGTTVAAAPSAPVIAPAAPPPAAAGGGPIAGPGAMAAAAARTIKAQAGARPPPVLQQAPAGRPAAPAAPPVAAAPPPAPAAPAPAPAPAPAVQSTGVTTEERGPPPPSGTLGALGPIHFYYLAASSEQTGLLSFKLSDRTIEVHFKKGIPEYVASTAAEDALPEFLRSQSLATAEQLAQAEAGLSRFGGDLVAALFGLGILNPASAFSQLAARASGLLLKALVAESGSFTYEPKELPPHKAMPLGNRWAVLSEQVRRIPVAELRRRLTPVMDLPLMKSGGRVATTDLRLTPQETRALGYVDGLRSLTQLMRDMPAEADTFARLAFYLRELEILSFASVRAAPPPPAAAAPPPAAAAPPPAAAARPAAAPAAGPGAKPAPARPAAAPARPAPAPVAAKPAAPPRPATPAPPAEPQLTPEQELPEVRARAAKLKDQTLFEVLGLTEKTDSSAVKAAYFKLAKQFHPDTVPGNAPAEYGKLKGEIFAKVGEAYRRLSDDASRAEYIEELKSGGAADIDVAQILQAEELFQKACILVKAKRFPDAVRMLDQAIGGNPQEGEFYAWRGFAKFFTFQDKQEGFKEAQKDLAQCVKMNERVAQAHYFCGALTKLMGDNAGAMKHFKRTLELRPDHVDAQREVRLASKK